MGQLEAQMGQLEAQIGQLESIGLLESIGQVFGNFDYCATVVYSKDPSSCPKIANDTNSFLNLLHPGYGGVDQPSGTLGAPVRPPKPPIPPKRHDFLYPLSG